MVLKVTDLFCGAGGLSKGFEMAGFCIKNGIDVDDYSLQTFDHNFQSAEILKKDIETLTDEYIVNRYKDESDVIIGGTPCQGFSVANMMQKDIKHDKRNRLFYEFMRFVKLLKPQAFVMENVKQILVKEKGLVKETMLKEMTEAGYNVNVKVLLASDYGVPQKRNRAFFVGIRNDINDFFDFNKIEKRTVVTVDDAISDLYYIDKECKSSKVDDVFDLTSKAETDYQRFMRKKSDDKLYNHNIRYPNDIIQERMSYVPQGGNWRDVPSELWENQRSNMHSNYYSRWDQQKPAKTVDTGHQNYYHPLYNRIPTVRESARIQSFSDDFIFKGSQTSQFRQVGNAVPPLLSYAIAKTLKKYLNT